jgi:hypothetical protein
VIPSNKTFDAVVYMQKAGGIYFETKNNLYRTIEEVLYVRKDYSIHEEPMFNGNSCHAVAGYYSSET